MLPVVTLGFPTLDRAATWTPAFRVSWLWRNSSATLSACRRSGVLFPRLNSWGARSTHAHHDTQTQTGNLKSDSRDVCPAAEHWSTSRGSTPPLTLRGKGSCCSRSRRRSRTRRPSSEATCKTWVHQLKAARLHLLPSVCACKAPLISVAAFRMPTSSWPRSWLTWGVCPLCYTRWLHTWEPATPAPSRATWCLRWT